jgi:Putative Flp pilus-assembly TadE/G-like
MSLSKFRIRIGTGRDRIDLSAKQAGQIIVLFALMLTSLIGLVGIAIDVTYAWRNGLQVQRAADAAAMAGVVYLPGNLNGATPSATSTALKIANANGYIDGTNATVTADYAPGNTRQLDVQVTASVPTFFVRLFGINNWTITRKARAAYIMPVPMGSPLSYMGVGCFKLATGTAPPCATAGSGYANSGVTTAGTTGGTPLGSLGAWGAISAPGGYQANGDAYAPKNNNDATWAINTTTNVMYPASPGGANGLKGYFYTVTIPPAASNGAIQIFDPGFCAMGAPTTPTGLPNYGAGDHWVNSGKSGRSYPVSTYYYVYNTNNQPLLGPTNWTYMNISSGSMFENETGGDNSTAGAYNQSAADACTAAAGNDDFHNKWYTLASGLPAGTYEVQVTTTNINPTTGAVTGETSDATNGQNMFAIQISDTGGAVPPTVFGYDKMAVYNNLAGSNLPQQFYIAQVDKDTGAGKTLTIDFFDIGDSSAGYIQILSPDGGTPHVVPFNYTTYNFNSSLSKVGPPGNCSGGTSDSCSGAGVTKITVAKTGVGSSFNNTWIEITIPLSSDPVTGYGATGLWGPDSNPANKGWWQIQYVVTAASDLTTWSVNVNGNPVHLVPIP